MFEVKDNKEIGAYLKKSILSKYRSCRQFCIAYLKFSGDDENPDEIRKLTNRVSQIINGKKTIQTYDLPLFSELLVKGLRNAPADNISSHDTPNSSENNGKS